MSWSGVCTKFGIIFFSNVLLLLLFLLSCWEEVAAMMTFYLYVVHRIFLKSRNIVCIGVGKLWLMSQLQPLFLHTALDLKIGFTFLKCCKEQKQREYVIETIDRLLCLKYILSGLVTEKLFQPLVLRNRSVCLKFQEVQRSSQMLLSCSYSPSWKFASCTLYYCQRKPDFDCSWRTTKTDFTQKLLE